MTLQEARKSIINDVINIEGGFSNDPQDSGGATMCGITEATASAHGYNVRTLTKEQAYTIYERSYWHPILLDEVYKLSPDIAAEMFDTGVNVGIQKAVQFLQRSLNALNNGAKHYADVTLDGKMGSQTLSALGAYLAKRGSKGEETLLNMLNSLQSTFYLELAEARPKDEKFQYGWQANRVDDVDTGSMQTLFETPDPAPQTSYTPEDVAFGRAPGASYFGHDEVEYRPLKREPAAKVEFNPMDAAMAVAARKVKEAGTAAASELPAEFYEWQKAQEMAKLRAQNTKPAHKSKIIGLAVGTLLTYGAAKYGLDVPPETAGVIENVIVVGGLGLIAIARRWFTDTFLG